MSEFFNDNKAIENLIKGTLNNLETLLDVNNIIGETIILPDGSIVIPISKVSVGYVVGGGEYANISKRKKVENYPLAGGSGGGVSVSPVGFLVQDVSGVKYIDIENKTAYQTMINLINKIIASCSGDKNEAKSEE